jgi:hypothetical protein
LRNGELLYRLYSFCMSREPLSFQTQKMSNIAKTVALLKVKRWGQVTLNAFGSGGFVILHLHIHNTSLFPTSSLSA